MIDCIYLLHIHNRSNSDAHHPVTYLLSIHNLNRLSFRFPLSTLPPSSLNQFSRPTHFSHPAGLAPDLSSPDRMANPVNHVNPV